MTTTPTPDPAAPAVPSLEALAAAREAATRASIAAAEAESNLALLTLAVATREAVPQAAYLSVTWSDQGGWLSAGEVYAADWELLDVDAPHEADSAAMCLYDSTSGTWAGYLRAEESDDPAKHEEVAAMFPRGAHFNAALDLAAILADAADLQSPPTPPTPGDEDMPIIAFDPESSDDLRYALESHFAGHNAHLTLRTGQVMPVQIVGVRAEKGPAAMLGIEYQQMHPELWEPVPGVEVAFVEFDQVAEVRF